MRTRVVFLSILPAQFWHFIELSKSRKNPRKKKLDFQVNRSEMDRGGGATGSEVEREDENEDLKDRFRLCTISIAEAEGVIRRLLYL